MYFVRPLGYVIKKLPVPTKQVIIRLTNAKPSVHCYVSYWKVLVCT